jgi:hypothetical protein
MSDYRQDHVKRDPETGAVAVRTIFPEEPPLDAQAWLIATVNRGAHFAKTSEVEAWDDLYEPPPAE